MSNYAIYIVVWNMTSPDYEQILEYWLDSIECKVFDSDVIIVGTHLDQSKREISLPKRLTTKFSKIIKKTFSVSCIDGRGIDELRQYLIQLALQKQIVIPESYIQLSESFNQYNQPFIEIENAKKMIIEGKQIDMNEEEFERALEVLHNLGYLLYYFQFKGKSNFKNFIILKPQWLVDVFKSIVTVNQEKAELIVDGWLGHEILPFLWSDVEKSLYPFLLDLLERFKIALHCMRKSLIPCRLNNVPNYIVEDEEYRRNRIMRFEFPKILPMDLFPSIIVSPSIRQYLHDNLEGIWLNAVQLCDNKILLWSHGNCIDLLGHLTQEREEQRLKEDVLKALYNAIEINWKGIC